MAQFIQQLTALGLDYQQASIYELLLAEGTLKAGQIAKKTPFKRGLVYKTLEELSTIGLIEKKEPPKKVATFTAAHPSKLSQLIDQQIKEKQDAKKGIADDLGDLTSLYNLANGKPGVEFYEGKSGVEHVLNDTLKKKGEIYTYADIEAVSHNIKSINDTYVKKRASLGIPKKALILDTPFARDYMKTYHKTVTDTRLISNEEAPPFRSIMEIYDGKISYITFENEIMVGMIIQDQAIYEMHKYLFEFMWNRGKFLK